MTWARIATLIVSIAATVAAGAGVIVLSVNGIHSQVAALQTQAAADRRAWQASMDAFRAQADRDREAFRAQAEADREAFRGEVHRLGERQARVEGALSIATAGQP